MKSRWPTVGPWRSVLVQEDSRFCLYTEIQRFSPVKAETSNVCTFFQSANFCHKPEYFTLYLIVVTLDLFTHISLLDLGYAADGSRLVAGVVAISSDKKKVLVVESTRRKNHWVLPKGGYETDEPSAEEAATRKNTLSSIVPFSSPLRLRNSGSSLINTSLL